MRIDFPAGVPRPTRAAIESAVQSFTMLESLVRWGFASQPPRPILEVVVQDEYTHDVVLRYDQDWFLVFDST